MNIFHILYENKGTLNFVILVFQETSGKLKKKTYRALYCLIPS